MKNFEKEYKELVKITKKINRHEEKKKKWSLVLDQKCSDFVEKYNEVNVKSLGINITNLLKNGVCSSQLVELLKSTKKSRKYFWSLYYENT